MSCKLVPVLCTPPPLPLLKSPENVEYFPPDYELGLPPNNLLCSIACLAERERNIAEQFLDRLLSDEAYAQPSDDGKAADLPMRLPPWYDENKFKTGQRFFWDNLYAHLGAQLSGLITIISIPTILNVLVHSKRSSSTFTAYRRYASTNLHVVTWNKYELKPGSRSWNSLLAVRTRHLNAGKNARTVGIGTVSQRDIALTQFGLVGYVLLCPDELGIQAFERDSWEGFNHFWRTCMYMMGLNDKYNLCSGTVEQTTDICRLLMRRVFAPLLEFPPEPLEHMAYVILDGIWSILPLSDPKAVWYLTRSMAGVPGYVTSEQGLIEFRRKLKNGEIEKEIKPVMKGWHEPTPRSFDPRDYELLSNVPKYRDFTFTERLKYQTINFLNSFYKNPIGKFYLNTLIRLMLFLTETFPILAFIRYGYSKSFVDIFEESIADKTKPMSNAEVIEFMNQPPWYIKWNPFYS